MTKIYYNPRCSTCRKGLAVFEKAKIDVEIIKYLENPLSEKELKGIIKKLGITPIELVRQKEAIWKEKFAGKSLSDEEIIQAMVTHPKLIQRPIVIKDNKAIIGRPPILIKEFLNL